MSKLMSNSITIPLNLSNFAVSSCRSSFASRAVHLISNLSSLLSPITATSLAEFDSKIGGPETVSNNRYPKIQDIFHIWVALQAKGSIPIFVFFNNKNQKRILSANESPRERMLQFVLYLF